MRNGMIRSTIALWAMLGTGGLCLGQWLNEGMLTATGTASLERMPDTLHLRIVIPAKGENIAQAIDKLKAKKEAASKKLLELGATGEAIKFADAKIAADPMEMMRQQMSMMEEEEAEEEEEAPKSVTVSVQLSATWPIKAADAESLLVFAHELQENLQKSDLAGLKDEKPTPEEEEEMAEMRERYPYQRDDQPTPGEPIIFFTSTVSDEDVNKLLAEAVADARKEAARLAAAAGAETGALVAMTTQRDRGFGDFNYPGMDYQTIQRAQAMIDRKEMEKMAFGMSPGKVSYQLSVMIGLKLK